MGNDSLGVFSIAAPSLLLCGPKDSNSSQYFHMPGVLPCPWGSLISTCPFETVFSVKVFHSPTWLCVICFLPEF